MGTGSTGLSDASARPLLLQLTYCQDNEAATAVPQFSDTSRTLLDADNTNVHVPDLVS